MTRFFILPFLLLILILILLSNSIFATVSYESKESKEISYSALKYGFKKAPDIKRLATSMDDAEVKPWFDGVN